MVAIARRGAADSLAAGITTTADYSFSGAAAAAANELGLRAIVYLEVFGADPAEAERGSSELRARRRGDRARTDRHLAARARTPARSSVYRWCLSLGIPVGTHLAESDGENEWLEHGTGPARREPRRPRRADGQAQRRHARRRARPGAPLRPLRRGRRRRDRAARRSTTCPVAHCPRSNALLGCGIAPLAALRAAGVRVGLGTDSPASTPSFDPWDELRAAILGARARERRPDALDAADALALATLDAAARARARRRGRQPHSRQAGRPNRRLDLPEARTIPLKTRPSPPSSAARRPACSRRSSTAQTRYRQGETAWQEVRSTASAARRRMLA